MAFFDLMFGTISIDFSDLWDAFQGSSTTTKSILIRSFRFPKTATALLAGASLAVSGLLMQVLFRNPLAGPYIFGINAGAGLGVALVVLGASPWLVASETFIGNSILLLAAWTGAAAVMLIVLFISQRIKNLTTILILGVLIGSGIGAIVSILQYFSQASKLKAFVIWTLGSLHAVSNSQLIYFFAAFLIGVFLALLAIPMLNVMLTGEQFAQSVGVRMKRVRNLSFFATSILAGTVTALCGPIGFIGIASPHIARLFLRTSNLTLLFLASPLVGANILLLADILSQLPTNGSVLPINALTSIIGIPIVMWVLIKRVKFL